MVYLLSCSESHHRVVCISFQYWSNNELSNTRASHSWLAFIGRSRAALQYMALCPSDIDIELSPNTAGASVMWPLPIATDNVEIASFTSTAQPGDYSSVERSSHVVVYTAVDSSGLKQFCQFSIRVTYAQQISTAIITVDALGITRSSQQDDVGLDSQGLYSDYLLHDGNVVTANVVQFTSDSSVNNLVVNITAGLGKMFSLRQHSISGSTPTITPTMSLEVDLRLTLVDDTGAQLSGYSRRTDAFVTLTGIEFYNPSNDTESAPQWLNLPPTMLDGSEFVSGHCARVYGLWNSIPNQSQFRGLSLALHMPTQPLFAANYSYTLALSPESFIRFSYFVDNGDVSFDSTLTPMLLQVLDEEPPLAGTCPSSLTKFTPKTSATVKVEWDEPAFTDNIHVAKVTHSHDTGSLFAIGMTSVEYTAVDD
jgi:hypothetical protein